MNLVKKSLFVFFILSILCIFCFSFYQRVIVKNYEVINLVDPDNSFNSLDVCPGSYDIKFGLFDSSVAPDSLYYAYIPVIFICLFLGLFILVKDKFSTQSKLFFAVAYAFCVWSISLVLQWEFVHINILYFLWETTPLLEVLIPVSLIIFYYNLLFNRPTSVKLKTFLVAVVLLVATLTPTSMNTISFNYESCEVTYGNLYYYVIYPFEILSIIIAIYFAAKKYLSIPIENKNEKTRVTILSTATIIFLCIFFSSNILAEVNKNYDINLVGPVGMVLFLLFIMYMTIRFQTFHLKVFLTQVLMIGSGLLIASQFFAPRNMTDFAITVFTFVAFSVSSFYVIRSVKKEIYEKEITIKLNKKIKQQSDKIALQKSSLEELLKVKDETLHIVNHQLNTPISVIKSSVSMLQDNMWTQEKFLNVVNREVERITDTIAQFLAAKKAENVEKGLVKTEADFGTLVKSLIDEKTLLKKVRENNIKILYKEDENLPAVACDVPKITEVISNLLDNAINYSSKDISVELKKAEKNVLLSVKDSGIGIPPEAVKNLFQRFSRLENAKKTRPDGTGLGLYVCKQIVEAHGGRIWVESRGVNQGSTFFVSLPV